jgi:TolB-like protein
MRALLLLLVASSTFATELSGPVAVMPFKNLNADPKLEFLRVGVAETLVTDIQKSGKLPVVERDQVDKALAEILLQGSSGTEESTAAKVGKLVGARTIVVGSYQEAGRDLRIVARFVRVETGEVLDTAKVTGPLGNVFLLQDQIVARLIGTPPRPAQRKTGERAVQAYRLYAMSLTTVSDADRVGYLRQSLEADPDFSYALDDLAKLEKRLAGYQKHSDEVAASRAPTLMRQAEDASASAQDRMQAAMALLNEELQGAHFRQLEQDAAHLASLELPRTPMLDPSELAAYYRFMALQRLKLDDRALSAGEGFLQKYPAGNYFQAVKMGMQQIIDARRRAAEGKELAEKELTGYRADREKLESDARAHGRAPVIEAECGYDSRECSALQGHYQYERAAQVCAEMHQKWRGHKNDTCHELSFMEGQLAAMSEAELGHFDRAWKIFEELQKEEPTLTRDRLAPMTQMWPKD